MHFEEMFNRGGSSSTIGKTERPPLEADSNNEKPSQKHWRRRRIMDDITVELAQAQLAQQARIEMAWEMFQNDGNLHLPSDDDWMQNVEKLL